MGFVAEQRLMLDNAAQEFALLGQSDENIKILESILRVTIHVRNGELQLSGVDAALALAVIHRLLDAVRSGDVITEQMIQYDVGIAAGGEGQNSGSPSDTVCLTYRGKPIKCKTFGQKRYIDAIKEYPITFGIGPAGTGKTFLAVAMAVKAFREKQVSRIVLTRPAVEAGERLGFLPGDLQNKVDPYLRPLYDALHTIMGPEVYQSHLEKGIIEVAPLAYMRGRTLEDAFIILDEAQNTTPEQMKMFLTRIGIGSQTIVTGDITQIDLPERTRSGLLEGCRILKGVDGISFIYLTAEDVVRHPLVQRIIRAYEKEEALKNAK